MAPFLYALTSSNINRFSELFHYQNQDEICNNLYYTNFENWLIFDGVKAYKNCAIFGPPFIQQNSMSSDFVHSLIIGLCTSWRKSWQPSNMSAHNWRKLKQFISNIALKISVLVDSPVTILIM